MTEQVLPERTPQQEIMFDEGYQLAHLANAVRDRREAAMDKMLQSPDETVGPQDPITLVKEYQVADTAFHFYEDKAGERLDSKAQPAPVDKPVTPKEEAAQGEVDPWSKLSPEDYRWGQGVITELHEKFGRVRSEFSPLMVKHEDGTEELAIALTATEGIDLADSPKPYDAKRNWDNTISSRNDKHFTITLPDGTKVDTRENVALPYLREIAKKNPKIYEWVWRTGEQKLADDLRAPLAYLSAGQVRGYRYARGLGVRVIRFRPVVVQKKSVPLES